MSVDEMQKRHEAELATVLGKLSGQGTESDWALARALVHKAVHLVADRKAAEFCAVATLFADMIGHAHQVMHPGDKGSEAHSAKMH
jgi:hypothetical protein